MASKPKIQSPTRRNKYSAYDHEKSKREISSKPTIDGIDSKNIISSHVLVEAFDGGKLIKSYYVGGSNQAHTGTNMLMKGSSRPFVMHIEGFHGFLTPRYFVNENEWRHRAIFEYKKDQIQNISIHYINSPEKDFNIYFNSAKNNFAIDYGKNLAKTATLIDTLGLSAYVKNYEMVHFEGFEETKPQSLIDSVIQSTPIFEIKLTTTQGKQHSVKGFKKPLKGGFDPEGKPTDVDIDRLYLLIDNESFVIGQYAIFDKLTRGINFFRKD